MREYSTPPASEVSVAGNLADDVLVNAQTTPKSVCLSRRGAAGWTDVTAAEFLDEVRSAAKGLIASGLGPGGRVALLSKTRYEWTLLDYAIWYAGGVSVPVYENSSVEHIAWVLSDSGATVCLAETANHGQRIDEVRGRLEELATVWLIDEGALDELSAAGAAVTDSQLEERRESVRSDTVATIIYTSGTTGHPKGCALTHGNFQSELGAATEELRELFDQDDASTLLFLPLAHVFARVIQVGAVKARVRLGHTADIKLLLEDLSEFRPSFILGVPRIFEQLFNTASQTAAANGGGKRFDSAAEVAIKYSKALDAGGPGPLLRARRRAYDRSVYLRLRTALGGRCRYAISGGAPLGERLGHFFRGVGVELLEGYGLTETTAAVALNLPSLTKVGTVGRPLAGTTIRVADDGELLVRGPQVFPGYWQDDSATERVLCADGWLHTGDLGEIDDEGFVRVTGRMTELIVTAGGKSVAPSGLEETIRAHPLVSQCMVVGDGQPFIAALITLDAEAVTDWAIAKGKGADLGLLVDDADLAARIQTVVDEANRFVSQAESIRKFRLLDVDWTEESGELTPSLKLRRAEVARRFASQIDALYSSS